MPRFQRRGRNFYGKHFPWVGGGPGGPPPATTPAFVTDTDAKAIQSMSRPALRTPTSVLGFGGAGGTVAALIERLSDVSMIGENATSTDLNRRVGTRHEYGKQTPVSRKLGDGDRLMILQVFGGSESGNFQVRRISDGVQVGSNLSNGGDLEFNWHVTNSELALYNAGINPATLREYNYNGGSPITSLKASPKDASAAAYYRAHTGQEGRPDFGWSKIGLRCRRGSDSGIVDICVWNFQTDLVVGRRQDIQEALSAIVAAGGSGYALNDVIEFVGGTRSHPARAKVTGISGGAVTAVSWIPGDATSSKGIYDAIPGNPVSTTAIVGAGTGCTLTVTWGSKWPDNIGTSPSGNYISMMPSSSDPTEYTELWDATSGTLAYVGDLHIHPAHGDWVRGNDGEDYWVYIANTTPQTLEVGGNQGIVRVRASTFVKTMILNQSSLGCTGWGMHVCGQLSKDFPGWCVISSNRLVFTNGQQKYSGEIFLLNIHTGETRRIGHHHSYVPASAFSNPYWAEPHVASCWDGEEVYFGSWWCDVDGTPTQGPAPSNHQLVNVSRSVSTVSVNDPAHGYSGTPQYLYLMEPSVAALVDSPVGFIDWGYRFQLASIVDADNYTYTTTSSGTISGASMYRTRRGDFMSLDFYRLKAPAGAYFLRAGD